MRYALSLLTIAAVLALGARAEAQIGGGVAGGGGALGGVAGNAMFGGRGMANGNLAGGGLGGTGLARQGMAVGSTLRGSPYNTSPGGGMAIGNALRGNPSGMAPGAQVAGGAGNAPTPNMVMGALGAGAGTTMQQGMPGAALGSYNMQSNGNRLAFRRGNNTGVSAQGGGGRFGGGTFQRYGQPTGRFSSWRGGGTPGSFGFGNRQNIGGFGFGYSGSPMFGHTARQQMYNNAFNGGGTY